MSFQKNGKFSYIDFIKTERDYKKSLKFEEDKSFWKDYFKTIPQIASIPSLAKNDEKKLSNKADRYDANLDKNLATKINKYCKKNKISVFDFLLSIYSVYLKKASNTEDFAIGTPIKQNKF